MSAKITSSGVQEPLDQFHQPQIIGHADRSGVVDLTVIGRDYTDRVLDRLARIDRIREEESFASVSRSRPPPWPVATTRFRE